MEQTVRRDPIFHETTPSIAPRPVCSAAFPTRNSLGQFCPNLASLGSVTWNLALSCMGATIGIPPIYLTEIVSNYRGKSAN